MRELTPDRLREVVQEACRFDPGVLPPDARLDDVVGPGVNRLVLVTALEAAYDVEFPDHLLDVIETVDDLIHFTNVKAAHGH
jgi:acyl carrier protein